MSVVSRLNHQISLLDRLGRQLHGASRFDVAVAFARVTGTHRLLEVGLPPSTRCVIGLGFAITEPLAVEALAAAAEVRLIFDHPETFHPKLYLITRPGELVVFSGSGNLTGGGLDTNIEQYEELSLNAPAARRSQRARFATLWDLGEPFAASSAAWKHYRAKHGELAQRRAELQRNSVALTTAVARRTRAASSPPVSRASAQAPIPAERRAQIAQRRGGKLTTQELHALLATRHATKRVAVTGRVDGTTQTAWLERLERAYPTIVVVNHRKVRDLDTLIVGRAPPGSTRPTNKRRNARADHANWIPFADARKLPRMQRAAG